MLFDLINLTFIAMEVVRLDHQDAFHVKQALILHEIKNQIHHLNIFHSELLEQTSDLPLDAQKAVTGAKKVTSLLEKEVFALLMHYRSSQGEKASIEQCWLADTVQIQFDHYREGFLADDEYQQVLSASIPEDFIWNYDDQLVGPAILNAVMNAFQAGASQVNVGVQEQEGICKILIDDDGPGFEKEEVVGYPTCSTGFGLELTELACHLHHRLGRTGFLECNNHSSLGGAQVILNLP